MAGNVRWLLAGAVLAVGCALASPAPAQSPSAAPASPGPTAPREAPGGSIEALWTQGERAYQSGDLEAAERLFEQALARDDRRARSWNYLGGVSFARGDLSRALEHFRRAHELDPGDVRACNNLATVHERLGEFARAEELYVQAMRLDPAYPETHRNLGVLYARRLGRPEEARRAWERFLALVPSGPAAAAVRRELEGLPPPPSGAGAAEGAP
jgi:tetratricopeptide (TPR) repeat protein